MGKRQVWSITACVFLFLSLASQIHCRSQTSHFNVIRRESVPSPKDKDLIEKLPGQPSVVSFKQYGGFVAVNETVGQFLYYYFVEAINATKSTPLVVWFNGGPGCSSLGGAFKEHGPFRVHSDGKTLFHNPYSWNREANMLYIEAPVSVGFSYSKTPLDMEKIGAGADKLTAEDNYKFLVNWLERFPEYKGREIHIAGQSYAGHYVPQLAQVILHSNNQTFINLRGIMIGNPAIDVGELEGHALQYMVTHGVVSQEFMDKSNKHCTFNDFKENPAAFEECSVWEGKLENIKQNMDVYNIHAPVCLNSTSSNQPKNCTTVMDVDPCRSNYLKAYLNSKEVQEAIHANTTKLPYAWDACNNELLTHWDYDQRYTSTMPILQELMGEGVRIMLYSGDLDSNVPFTSTLAVLKDMNLTVVKEWRSWFTQGQVGGYTEVYNGNLTFATVKGAGHHVPTDQPIRALTLFTSYIHNTPLPQTP